VVGITSAAPSLHRYAVALSVGFTVLLMLANLRGVRESGRAFAIPTYTFVALTYLMFLIGAIKGIAVSCPTQRPPPNSCSAPLTSAGSSPCCSCLRAFASGCTALTGVEAISNGVPAFRHPKARNAANTLAIMGLLAVSMFVGITVFALHLKLGRSPAATRRSSRRSPRPCSAATRSCSTYIKRPPRPSSSSPPTPRSTASRCCSSILAEHGYLPRQMRSRGDKLVFSNGIILLGAFAIALIIGFDANIDKLIQLYIIGVFTSFTLSQAGMVRHWNRTIPRNPPERRRRMRISRAINLVGSHSTACGARHRPVHQNRPRRLARHPRHDHPLRRS
jgi:amino acid transporter